MEVKATFKGPLTVADAKLGQIMVAHHHDTRECFVIRTAPGTASPLKIGDDSVGVVVLGNRVDPTEPGYLSPGLRMVVPADTPATFLEQITPLRLREQTVAGTHAGVTVETAGVAPATAGLFANLRQQEANPSANGPIESTHKAADAAGESLGDALFTVLFAPLLRGNDDDPHRSVANGCRCIACEINALARGRSARRDRIKETTRN